MFGINVSVLNVSDFTGQVKYQSIVYNRIRPVVGVNRQIIVHFYHVNEKSFPLLKNNVTYDRIRFLYLIENKIEMNFYAGAVRDYIQWTINFR